MKPNRFLGVAFMLASVTCTINASAQSGISVSPSRLYYNSSASGTKAQKVIISNPNDKPLQIGVSVSDWAYDSLGNNRIVDAGKLPNSCAAAVKVLEGSFFTLKPHEEKQLTIQFSSAAIKKSSTEPYKTSMLFFTQLNPGSASKTNGAAIKVTVRMGVKIYYTSNPDGKPELEITNLKDRPSDNGGKTLHLSMENKGKIWADGQCKWTLLNSGSGEKTTLEETGFYTLPGDKRILKKELPSSLPKGKYTATAILTYGKDKEIKVAELEFAL
jgi:P pilus assembly chaperone PapD